MVPELVDRGLEDIVEVGQGEGRQLVELETQAILDGRTQLVRPTDDHDLHIDVHRSMLLGSSFDSAPRSTQLALLHHVAQHLLAQNGGQSVYVSQTNEDYP